MKLNQPSELELANYRQTSGHDGLETNFIGHGHSHFSYLKKDSTVLEDIVDNCLGRTGFHVTTQIPGVGQSEGLDHGLSLHEDLWNRHPGPDLRPMSGGLGPANLDPCGLRMYDLGADHV